MKAYIVLAGREATLAYKDGDPYLVYRVSGAQQVQQHWALEVLSKFPRPVFLHVYEVFSVSAVETLVVTEYINVSLADVAVCEQIPSEGQVASIASQAS